jgi:hypothetical protein
VFIKLKITNGNRKSLYEKARLFLFILVCNVSFFLFWGGVVIYRFIEKRNDEQIQFVDIKPNETPKPKPPATGGDAAKSLAEVSPTVIPPTILSPSLVVTPDRSINFNMLSTPISLIAMTLPPNFSPSGTGLGTGSTGGGQPQSNPFGVAVNSSPEAPLLIGYMFDLKQTPHKQPTGMDLPHFYRVLRNFANNHFDETLLQGYYRTRNELGTAAISIPQMPSSQAPKAFGEEKEVQASLWMIHYHGLVSAPENGDYSLAGTADNVLIVAMNGKIVLDASSFGLAKDDSVRVPLGEQHVPKFPSYFKGKTFHADAGEPISMDVVIADDGGATHFSLYLIKKGKLYQKGDHEVPIMPIFRLNDKSGLDTPVKCPPWAIMPSQ